MNADKNGIQMSNAVHQYALSGTPYSNSIKRLSTLQIRVKQIVICNNGPDIRYATLEEWDKAGKSFGERAQTEGIVTSASPARDKLEALSQSFYRPQKMCTLTGIAEKTGGIGYTPACANEWKPGISPKQTITELNALNARSRTFPLS